jgi:hypothetical protein
MSLSCHEGRDHFLKIADEAFCATTSEAVDFSAVCQLHIGAIPAAKRSKGHIDGGLDIHYLHSTPNKLNSTNSNLRLFGAEIGDFKFSISAKDAGEYLPFSAQKYLT